MKELIELHSLEFQVIKEQLKEEEQQRKKSSDHVIYKSECNASCDQYDHVTNHVTEIFGVIN